MRFKDREERERYMDSLERQMEHQREQIRRTLDRREEGSGRRRTALKSKLRSSLPSFPGRKSVRDAGEEVSEAATERPDSEAPRSWWEFWR